MKTEMLSEVQKLDIENYDKALTKTKNWIAL